MPTIKRCEHCGGEYEGTEVSQFDKRECYWAAKHAARKVVRCAYGGAEFLVSGAKAKTVMFCSRRCEHYGLVGGPAPEGYRCGGQHKGDPTESELGLGR